MHSLTEALSLLVPSLGWALLDFVWQGMLVGWAAALLFASMRNSRPQARYLVGCAALCLCLALPVAGFVQRLAAPPGHIEPVALLLDAAAGDDGAQAPGAAAAATTATASRSRSALAQALPAALSAERLAGWRGVLQARLPLVIVLWGCGVAMLGLRLVLGLVWVRQRSASARHQVNGAWQSCADTLARRLGIARLVRVGVTDDSTGPVTAGWWRPVVLLPASLAIHMPRELLEALLAHELAHVKRHDYLVNLIQSAIEVLLFYHPTVWWLSARVRVEREQIADDLAAGVLGEPRRLALALSELDRFQFDAINLAPAANGGKLMSRIKRLIRPAREPLSWKTMMTAAAVPILGLSAACTVLYAQAQNTSGPSAPGVQAAAEAARASQAAAQAGVAAAQTATRAATQAAAQASHAAAQASKAAAQAARNAAHVGDDGDDDGDDGHVTVHHNWEHGDPYAIVRDNGHGTSLNGSGGDWREIEAIKRKVPGEFIWFREGAKSYVIQDQAVLSQARAAWTDVDKLGAEMEGYGKQMEQHGKVMEGLGRKMEAAGRASKPAPDVAHAFERKVKDLARQQRDLNRQVAAAERAAEQADGNERDARRRELSKLEAQLEQVETTLDAEQDKFNALYDNRNDNEMDAIGRQMDEAGKPMDALGKQMDVLGKRMDKKAEVADKATRAIIRDAKAKGLAIPAPGAT